MGVVNRFASSLLVAATSACLSAPPDSTVTPDAGTDAASVLTGMFLSRDLVDVDLTELGTLDWAHWGLDDTSDINRKSGVEPAIATFWQIGGSPILRLACCNDFSWSDGTPTSTADDVVGGVFIDTDRASGDGLRFSVAAGTAPRRLTVYVGGWCARLRFEAALTGAPPFSHKFDVPGEDWSTAVYQLDFAAASEGGSLTVTYLIDENPCTKDDLGEAWLLAATLAEPP
jgi:hypothetical protein